MIKIKLEFFIKVIAISFLISFLGCNEEETPHNIFNLPTSIKTTSYSQGGKTNQSYFKYDSNRLIQISGGGLVHDFIYENSLLVRINESYENDNLRRYTELAYQDGRLVQSIEFDMEYDNAEKIIYEYDSNTVIRSRYWGNSSSQTENEIITSYIKETGNIVKILDLKRPEIETRYYYDQNINPFRNLHQLEVLQMFYSFGENNKLKIEYLYSGEVKDYYFFEYQYNSSGYPKSVITSKNEILSLGEFYY